MRKNEVWNEENDGECEDLKEMFLFFCSGQLDIGNIHKPLRRIKYFK